MTGPHASAHADPIARALARAHGVLPDQGPIGVFIHHNTLHAFQHLPFHEGVQAGAAALGARPYLALDEFRDLLRAGRIDDAEVRAGIDGALGGGARDEVLPGLSRAALWHTLMVHEAEAGDAAGLAYAVRAGLAEPCSDGASWEACVRRTAWGPALAPPDDRRWRRHRDVLLALGGADPDVPVHAEMIALSAAFLDHGQARTAMPGREGGFLQAVAALYASGAAGPRACPGADADLRSVAAGRADADAVVRRTLDALGVAGDDVEPFLLATALALPGWAGMFSRMERHPAERPEGVPVALYDFVALRLLFERRAIERTCDALGVSPHWPQLRERIPAPPDRPPILDAVLLWYIVRAAGLPPGSVTALSDDAVRRLWHEVVACTPLRRRQLFLDAFERTYRGAILDAVAARRAQPLAAAPGRPRAQFVFCIDEREESTRRAIEEQSPGYVTYGVAGFFGVAIDYLGLYDAHPAAHCPVVVTPAHEVHEGPVHAERDWHDRRLRLRDRWHGLERWAQRTSRSLTGGAGLSFLLGPVSAANTFAQLIAPRSLGSVTGHLIATLAPRPVTRLSALRDRNGEPAATGRPKPVGFSLPESVDRVAGTLRNIGLVRDFAPSVVVLGHGSTSLNNPHESAHDCGACGGRRGGANARLFADLANRPDVRAGLRSRGIDIPPDTWFVGALHDTADDSVRYFDLDGLTPDHVPAFAEAHAALERARRENARERARRFDNAPLSQSPDDALRHVEVRSTLYAQPRPEYGHCTNSICIVGRRETTRGLHLDRRAFLVSYDPTLDPDDAILERILAAVGPVGAGISLEYYFSAVDNEVFGCGTKLPHNVAGLIGVMNGHQGDLRTGLPLQMVEIHDALRLLLIVEATPEALLGVAARQPEVAELVVGAWVQLVSMDPRSGALQVFERGRFVPYVPRPVQLPVVERSPEWHLRSRDHLPPALVRSALAPAAPEPAPEPLVAAHV